jgi:hypothetical protein
MSDELKKDNEGGPPPKGQPFNIFGWSDTIPFSDDVWLGMQARNIVIVDRIVRHFEQVALNGFYENDRFSMDDLMPLNAMSQVWIFALYEFLPTWLQRASKLIGYADRLAGMKTTAERAVFLKAIEAEAREKGKYVRFAPVFYYDHVARVGDEKFIASIRTYREKIRLLFRDLEAIRMPLAKHEISGTKASKFMAEAPGYGRVNVMTGSVYWQIALTDGTVDVIDRHSLADRFFGTATPQEASAWPRLFAASMKTRKLLRACSCPMNSASSCERKEASAASSSRRSAETRRRGDVLTGRVP